MGRNKLDDFPNPVPSDELPPDLLVREKLKHHSMCLFGLATDLQAQEDKYRNYANEIEQLQTEIKELKCKLRKATNLLVRYRDRFGHIRRGNYEKKETV